MPIPEDEPFAEPIIIHDALTRIASRVSLQKARSSESTVVWAVAALIGFSAIGYAIHLANQPGPAVVVPDPVVIYREPAPSPKPRPARAFAKEAANIAPEFVKAVEPVEKKAVDPIDGFETGEAFDNPTRRDRERYRANRKNAPDPSFRPQH